MRPYLGPTKQELTRARDMISNRDDNTCQICLLDFNEIPTAKKNIDHIIPRSAIAWSHPFNLQLLCRRCNAEKGSDIPVDFYELVIKNSAKTARWFAGTPPTGDSMKERNYVYAERIITHLPPFINYAPKYDFESHFEVLYLHYDDEYINAQTGMSLEDLESGRVIFRGSWDSFRLEIKSEARKASHELLKLANDFRGEHKGNLKAETVKVIGWHKAMAFKLRRIHEGDLARSSLKVVDTLRSEMRHMR